MRACSYRVDQPPAASHHGPITFYIIVSNLHVSLRAYIPACRRQYHTLSLGRLFKEKLLAIASRSDECDSGDGISSQGLDADALTCATFSPTEVCGVKIH